MFSSLLLSLSFPIMRMLVCWMLSWRSLKMPSLQGFPGGSVVKHPPANARDTGSIPGLGRPHKRWSDKARVATTTEASVLYSPWSATREATTVRSPHPTASPCSLQPEKSPHNKKKKKASGKKTSSPKPLCSANSEPRGPRKAATGGC